jgi:HK97 family phage portal protein
MVSFPKFWNKRKTTPSQVDAGVNYWFGSSPSSVDEETAMTVAAFNRGVIYLATQMSKLPWEVKNVNKEVQTNHDLNRILNRKPNTENTAFMLKMFIMISAIVNGNGYFEIEINPITGKILGLWPIEDCRVSLQRMHDNSLVYIVSDEDGEKYLRPEQMFHLRNFMTWDGLNGRGVVEYAKNALSITVGADKFAGSLYNNAGMPSGILSFEGKLSAEATERIKQSWQAATSGRKVGSVAVLEEGASFNPITFQPDILQFIETRKFGIPEISRFLGVPPQKLFSQEHSTYNNNEQANSEVVTDTIGSWAANLENEADFKLIGNDMSLHTEFDLFELSKGDMDTRSQYYTRMMSIGSMTPNQVRLKEGYAPYEDGDRYYIATNNYTPADKVDEVIESQIAKPEVKEKDKEEKDLDKAVTNYLNNQTR